MPARDAKAGVDTNVLVYAVDAVSGEKHETAKAVVRGFRQQTTVVPLQALAEFYVTVLRKRAMTHHEAATAISAWTVSYTIASADQITLFDAFDAVQRYGLSFWDALILDTVRRAGCTVLLTADMQDGAEIDGVRILNPFRGGRLPAEVRALLS